MENRLHRRPGNLMAEFRKVHQYNVFCHNTPVQYALADFVGSSNHHKELAAFYQERRDVFLKASKTRRLPPLRPAEPTSSCWITARLTRASMLWPSAGRWGGIASIPVSVFYHQPVHEHMLRFCFAKSNDTLERGLARLRAIG